METADTSYGMADLIAGLWQALHEGEPAATSSDAASSAPQYHTVQHSFYQ
jgi:hypothetical protein